MKIRCALLVLLALSGCELLQKGGVASAKSEPYESSVKKISADNYEMTMTGKSGVTIAQLKKYFKEKGNKLCGDKVYLLRGMREEDGDNNQNTLRGYIDCVGLDYFKDK